MGIFSLKNFVESFKRTTLFFPKLGNLSESATTLVRSPGEIWVITDHGSGRVYTIRKEGAKLNVYLGIHPEAATHQIADIVIVLDYSRSMGGKSETLMLGISALIGRLQLLPIDYQIGLIRFAKAKDAIKSVDGADVIQMPLGETGIRDPDGTALRRG